MALAPDLLPSAPKGGVVRRLRSLVPARGWSLEYVHRRDPLTTPSDIALRSVGRYPLHR
jgi:hypothetical protein